MQPTCKNPILKQNIHSRCLKYPTNMNINTKATRSSVAGPDPPVLSLYGFLPPPRCLLVVDSHLLILQFAARSSGKIHSRHRKDVTVPISDEGSASERAPVKHTRSVSRQMWPPSAFEVSPLSVVTPSHLGDNGGAKADLIKVRSDHHLRAVIQLLRCCKI